MAYYNPHLTGWYNPFYTANNQGFGHCFDTLLDAWHCLFGHCSFAVKPPGTLLCVKIEVRRCPRGTGGHRRRGVWRCTAAPEVRLLVGVDET